METGLCFLGERGEREEKADVERALSGSSRLDGSSARLSRRLEPLSERAQLVTPSCQERLGPWSCPGLGSLGSPGFRPVLEGQAYPASTMFTPGGGKALDRRSAQRREVCTYRYLVFYFTPNTGLCSK